MAKDDKDRISKEALKAADDYIKKTEQAKKNVQAMQGAFDTIATQLFGISGAAFFKETTRSLQETKELQEEYKNLEKNFIRSTENIAKVVDDTFGHAIKDIQKELGKMEFSSAVTDGLKKYGDELKSIEDINQKIDDLAGTKAQKDLIKLRDQYIKEQEAFNKTNYEKVKELADLYPEMFSDLGEIGRIEKIAQLSQVDWNKEVQQGGDLFLTLAKTSEDIPMHIAESADEASKLKKGMASVKSEIEQAGKKTFDLSEGFMAITKNFVKGILPKMMEFDQAMSDAGRDFGFAEMKSERMAGSMASLGQSAARFNVSMKDAIGMMGGLGEELATIDQDYLANSVEHFMAIEKATGISSEEITTIAGEMMRAGKSAEQVETYMEGANKMSKKFSVNTKKVLQGVARNIDKMRQMGFQGGEESLTRMVATAERLRMDVDEIFDVAAKARTIEGAMDMAAELQLAGGSFANIDPMSLLAAARKGPEELQKILTQMGDDIGTWNEETGTLEFDAVDADRLQMVADATGQSVDSISKMIQKNAEDNAKVDLLGLDSAIDDDAKMFMQDMTKIGEGGQIEMSSELQDLASSAGIDIANVDDLQNLSQEEISALMEEKALKEKTLAEQAEQNQSFQESIQAFKDAIMNLFVVFEPFIKVLTSMVQTLNGMPGPIKMLVAGLIGFIAIAPKLGMAMDGLKKGFGMMKGVLGKMKGALGIGQKAAGGGQDALAGQINQTTKGGGEVDKAKGSGGGLKSLAEGLKAMGDKDVFKGIGAVALAGPALLLMLPGVPTILAMGLVGLMGPTVEKGFRSLANGIAAMGNAKGIWKGLAVMALVGLALIPFAAAAHMMTGVDWLSVLAGIGILSLVVLGLIAMGVLLTGPQLLFLLYAVGILVLIGASLLVFGIAMQQFAQGAQMMQGMDFSWLSNLGWALFEAAPGLILGGLAIAAAAPMLLIGSMGLLALGVAATMLSNVDWEAFGQIGNALMSLIPGLLGFSLAGLMFVNPITLLGMILMMSTLAGLAAVMVPLSESLGMGADGLDRFADGLAKLQEAANSLDLEKLDALRSLAWSMAIAGIGGGMLGAQIDQIAEALAKLSNAGGGGKGGGTQKIQVDLKLNGRDLQSIIVDDTEIVS